MPSASSTKIRRPSRMAHTSPTENRSAMTNDLKVYGRGWSNLMNASRPTHRCSAPRGSNRDLCRLFSCEVLRFGSGRGDDLRTQSGARELPSRGEIPSTFSAELSAGLCQCAEDLRQVVTLRQQGYRIPLYHPVSSEAVGPQRLGALTLRHVRMFSVRRAHSPPGNGFGLNLRI